MPPPKALSLMKRMLVGLPVMALDNVTSPVTGLTAVTVVPVGTPVPSTTCPTSISPTPDLMVAVLPLTVTLSE